MGNKKTRNRGAVKKNKTNKETHRSIFRQVEKDSKLDHKWDQRAAEAAEGSVSGEGSLSELPQENREKDTQDVDNVVYLK